MSAFKFPAQFASYNKGMNKQSSLLCPLSLFAVALIGAACPPAPALAQPKDEWQLTQSTPDLGKHKVFVTSDGVKIVSEKWGFELLCKAPDWKVYCYRPAEKLIWTAPLKDFSSLIMTNPYGSPNAKVGSVEPVGEMTVGGVRCKKYRERNRSHSFVCGAVDIPISPEGARFVSRYYFTPKISQMPILRVVDHKGPKLDRHNRDWLDTNIMEDLRGGARIVLSTTSCRKGRQISSHFAVPRGYKQTNDIKQVTYSKKAKEQLNNMLDSLGFTSDDKARH